jgi:hypothetical protein
MSQLICGEKYFKPTIELTRVIKKNNRQKVAASLKNKIPISAVPAAPIPVHTAYAVPIGRLCVALYKRYMLSERERKNPSIHHGYSGVPEASFALDKQVVKPTSNSPANMRMNHAIAVKLAKNSCSKKG